MLIRRLDDELSDDGESALNGMSLKFDGDDYESYDEFERDKNRLLAMGVFDDGSRGYDAPATGLWLARGRATSSHSLASARISFYLLTRLGGVSMSLVSTGRLRLLRAYR